MSAASLLVLQLGSMVVGCFPAEAGLRDGRAEWYCKHLKAASLGPLVAGPSYRFTYLRTFHAPLFVVVEPSAKGPVLTGLVLSGRGGYDPGSMARRTRRVLGDSEWKLLEQRLENAGIWEPEAEQSEVGLDGAQWILEGRRGGRYQLHDLWSPNPKQYPQYVKACMYLLELAGIQPKQDELY